MSLNDYIFTLESVYFESAKLRALGAHVPTCLACLRARVLTCLAY